MGRFFEIPVYRVHRYISIKSHRWEKVRIDYAIFRWEHKTDGGNKKVMIQSNLAGLVDTMVAMSKMRTEGNERTFDAACSAALRSSPQRMRLAATPSLLISHISSFFISVIVTCSKP